MPQEDITQAVKALNQKQDFCKDYWAYYDGNQPIVYASNRLRETFKSINVRFITNWCAMVVNSTADRIDLTGFTVNDDDGLTAKATEIWQGSQLDLEADDVTLGALVCGESFLIGQKGDDGKVKAYYNAPQMCAMFYDGDDPHKKKFAAKWWRPDPEKSKVLLNLYYPDKIEKYSVESEKGGPVSDDAKKWDFIGEEKNESGVIPVFHFRRERRTVKSELKDVTPLQDAVNKLMADMMVAAEMGAFKQRWIISQAEVSDLKNGPNQIWNLPAGDGSAQNTEVGEFEPEDLKNFIDAIDRLTSEIAIISATPKHYLLKQGGDPSGEALIAMESPLNKKCQKYVGRFSATWKEAMAFLLTLSGAKIDADAITPVYAPVATVQPLTESQILMNNTSAGIPLKTVLRDEGWTEDELKALDKDRAEDDERSAQNMARTAELGVKSFNRGSEA